MNKLKELQALSRLSWEKLATATGYSEGQKLRDIAKYGKGMSGPAKTAIGYVSQGILDDAMKQVVPEFIFGQSLQEGAEQEYVIRMWFPRFFGIVGNEAVKDVCEDAVQIAPGEWLGVGYWIDRPVIKDRMEPLKRAATMIEMYTQDSMGP